MQDLRRMLDLLVGEMELVREAARKTKGSVANLKQNLMKVEKSIKQPSPECLDTLIRAYVTHIPFENLTVAYFHEVPGLGINDLYDKMIMYRRGGYCHEMNGLFLAFLQTLGFEAYSVSVFVREDLDYLTDLGHRSNICVIDGVKYFVEAGYGGSAPVCAVPLDGQTRGKTSRKTEDGIIFHPAGNPAAGRFGGEHMPERTVFHYDVQVCELGGGIKHGHHAPAARSLLYAGTAAGSAGFSCTEAMLQRTRKKAPALTSAFRTADRQPELISCGAVEIIFLSQAFPSYFQYQLRSFGLH